MQQGVLLVGTFSSTHGVHRTYCEDLADRLELRGWDVVRTSSRQNRVRRVADMMTTAWSHRHRYTCAHVDVFSGAAFAWAEAVCFELRRLRKPYALTLRGGNLPAFAQRWPRRVRKLLRSTPLVTAPSAYLRDALSEHADEIVVVPNALDLAAYPFRHRTQLQPRLVWLRAFHEVYNPVMAIEVLARLAARHAGASLTMIGADKGDGSLQAVSRRAAELGVRDRLRIVPGVPKAEVPHRLAEADIFVNTTNVDNAPVSVIEAMACGLGVVTTAVGGIPKLVEHERDAWLVPAGDAGAMTIAIEQLLADDARAARLSLAARERAVASDWSHVLARWESIFSQLGGHA